MTRTAIVLSLVLAVVGGSAGAAIDAGGTHPEIVNGAPTATFPSTGALLLGGDPETATSLCSGVLIGCQTFLTAAHCVCASDGSRCQGWRAPAADARIVYLEHAGFFDVFGITVHPEYRFPVADLAVITLARPVTGISPSPITTVRPAAGTSATIVGFGRSSGGAYDFGLKRVGYVTTGSCPRNVSEETSICWSFDGAASDSCQGDSGGPLFVQLGSAFGVAGITSGGSSASCLPGDVAYDTDVSRYAGWIRTQAGSDLDRRACSGVPPVGGPRATVAGVSGSLGDARDSVDYAVQVPAGTNELRVALHGTDDGVAYFEMYVKDARPPTVDDYDCHAGGASQYAYCPVLFPAPGTWHVLVRRKSGAGSYQLTATVLGGDPPVCGNGLIESGEECDATDDGACPGACDPTCRCTPACERGGIVNVRGQLGPRFLVKATVMHGSRTYDDLDPRTSEFTLTFHDAGTPVEVVIPADDARWTALDTGRYEWRGTCGDHRVVLRYRRLANGNGLVTLKGKRKSF